MNIIGGFLSPVTDAYKKEVNYHILPSLHCQGLVSAAHRVKMCELAAESSDWVAVDKWESEQSEYQTTIAVLDHFHYGKFFISFFFLIPKV
jgi:nicotinamide mononucleotide adenylyltransferase